MMYQFFISTSIVFLFLIGSGYSADCGDICGSPIGCCCDIGDGNYSCLRSCKKISLDKSQSCESQLNGLYYQDPTSSPISDIKEITPTKNAIPPIESTTFKTKWVDINNPFDDLYILEVWNSAITPEDWDKMEKGQSIHKAINILNPKTYTYFDKDSLMKLSHMNVIYIYINYKEQYLDHLIYCNHGECGGERTSTNEYKYSLITKKANIPITCDGIPIGKSSQNLTKYNPYKYHVCNTDGVHEIASYLKDMTLTDSMNICETIYDSYNRAVPTVDSMIESSENVIRIKNAIGHYLFDLGLKRDGSDNDLEERKKMNDIVIGPHGSTSGELLKDLTEAMDAARYRNNRFKRALMRSTRSARASKFTKDDVIKPTPVRSTFDELGVSIKDLITVFPRLLSKTEVDTLK